MCFEGNSCTHWNNGVSFPHLTYDELIEMRFHYFQMQEQNQTVALLKQDKEYLNNRLYELTPRYKLLEEKYDSTYKQLDEVKLAREELYEKYLNSR